MNKLIKQMEEQIHFLKEEINKGDRITILFFWIALIEFFIILILSTFLWFNGK